MSRATAGSAARSAKTLSESSQATVAGVVASMDAG